MELSIALGLDAYRTVPRRPPTSLSRTVEGPLKPVIFKGYDRALNAPRDWKPSRDGSCSALPVRITSDGTHPLIQSYWKPDAAELKALNEGYSVCLSIVGHAHPPVMLFVQNVEEHEIPDNLIPKGTP